MADVALRADRLLAATTAAMVAVDVGFVVYWTAVVARLLPPEAMFAEYTDPRVAAWNWSFLPLDLTASAAGLLAVAALRAGSPAAAARLSIALTLTAVAGGTAVVYWALRGQWDPWWVVPNLALLLVPLPMLARLTTSGSPWPRAVVAV